MVEVKIEIKEKQRYTQTLMVLKAKKNDFFDDFKTFKIQTNEKLSVDDVINFHSTRKIAFKVIRRVPNIDFDWYDVFNPVKHKNIIEADKFFKCTDFIYDVECLEDIHRFVIIDLIETLNKDNLYGRKEINVIGFFVNK